MRQHPDLSVSYRSCDFFAVRTPVYPFTRLVEWGSEQQPLENRVSEALHWSTRRAQRVVRLRDAFIAETALREATFFASPNVARLIAECNGDQELPAKLLRTLTRYFIRAAGRETPFGLFAGVSCGRITDANCFELEAASEYRRRTSVALEHLNRVLLELAARDELRDQVPHELNSSVALVQGNFRFATSDAAGDRFMAELTQSAHLERSAALAELPVTPEQLARSLARGRLKYADTLNFARILCKRGFLVPCWLPAVTGVDPLAAAIAALSRFTPLSDVARSLKAVAHELKQGDAAALGVHGDAYRKATEVLTVLFPARNARPVLQTQLHKPAPRLSMSEDLAARFLVALDAVQRTGRATREPALAAFCNRFRARYETRLVPLAEALDADVGVGFGPPEPYATDALLSNIPKGSSNRGSGLFDELDAARLQLLQNALARGQTVCELDQAALALFPNARADELPESLAIMARLARTIDGRLLVVAPTVVAPSAVSTLARFCTDDPHLDEALKRLVTREQELAGDALLADVAHLPHDEGANVILRPRLRAHEIPYFGKSGAPPDEQIRISDLYVGVEEDRVVLYSAHWQRRVKIRISNAHNFAHESHLAIYRFLGALQHQDESGLVPSWSWGVLAGSEFLPRVVLGDTVLSVASWRLSSSELKPIIDAVGATAFELLQVLRRKRGLPRWLARAEGDQRLVVDLDNELSVEELLYEARKRASLNLEELVPNPDELVVSGPEGAFTAEFVVPFLRLKQTPRERVRVPPALHNVGVERRRAPGSNWLYVKVYTGRSQTHAVLRLIRDKVVEPMLGSAVKRWFYLPHADSDPHLRVRFCGSPSKLTRSVLPKLQRALEPLLRSGAIWRLQLDTYEQEIERYGGPVGVELAEWIFSADSNAACQLLDICEDDDELRWQLTLVGIDRLLADGGLALEQREQFARSASDDYGFEFHAITATWQAIGTKYRIHAPRLSELLWQRARPRDRAALAEQVLERRSASIAPLWAAIQQAQRAGQLRASNEQLLRSFAHLFAVRMLGFAARGYELLLYGFLRRQYSARLAQGTGVHVSATESS